MLPWIKWKPQLQCWELFSFSMVYDLSLWNSSSAQMWTEECSRLLLLNSSRVAASELIGTQRAVLYTEMAFWFAFPLFERAIEEEGYVQFCVLTRGPVQQKRFSAFVPKLGDLSALALWAVAQRRWSQLLAPGEVNRQRGQSSTKRVICTLKYAW